MKLSRMVIFLEWSQEDIKKGKEDCKDEYSDSEVGQDCCKDDATDESRTSDLGD